MTKKIDPVFDFLLGAGPLEGLWWGDYPPEDWPKFWWRKHLRAALLEALSNSDGLEVQAEPMPTQLAIDKAVAAELEYFCRNVEWIGNRAMIDRQRLKDRLAALQLKEKQS